MSLPLDISSSLWFMPTAVWEWETVPPPPPEANASCDAPAADGTPSVTTDIDPTTPDPEPNRRLVFKGFANSSQFHWFFAESPVSRPWIENHLNEGDERKPKHPEPLPRTDLDPSPGDTDPKP
jgi:hypothetical protein